MFANYSGIGVMGFGADAPMSLKFVPFTATLYKYLQHKFIINFSDFDRVYSFFYGFSYENDTNLKRLQEIKDQTLQRLKSSKAYLSFDISDPSFLVDAVTAQSNLDGRIAFVDSFRKLDVNFRNLLIRLVNEGYVDRNLRIVVDKLNKYLPDGRKLSPIPIDFTSDWGSTLWFIGSFGPWLIEHGWLTKQPDGTFSATYGDKGLDHAEVSIYDPYKGSNRGFVIRDTTFLEAILTLLPVLQVPKAQIDQLVELTGHVSGAEWHDRAVKVAEAVVAVAVAIYVAGVAANYLIGSLGPTGQVLAAGSKIYESATGKQGLSVIQNEMTKPFMQDLMKKTIQAGSNSGYLLPDATVDQLRIVAGAIVLDDSLDPATKQKALTLLSAKTGDKLGSPGAPSGGTARGSENIAQGGGVSETKTGNVAVGGIAVVGAGLLAWLTLR